MQNSNNITSVSISKKLIEIFPGALLHVSPDSRGDYLEMRAAQLCALNHLLTSGDFEGWDETIKADAKWLAATLATEVSQLVSVVTFRENLEKSSQKV